MGTCSESITYSHIFPGSELTYQQYDGGKGVDLMLDTLYNEFKRCMQLTGCNSVKDITKACLGIVRSDGPLARL